MYSLGSSFRHNFHFCKCRALVPNFARLARQNCACAVDARLLSMCGRRDSNDWTAVVTTMNILIFSYFQIRFSDPSLREGRRRWGSKMERFLLMMKIHDSSSSCGKCEKGVMTRRKSIMWSTKQLQSELEIAVYVKNDYSREGISSGIMCSTMNFRLYCMRETFFLEKEFHKTPSALPWDRMLLKVILTCPCNVISSLSE